MLDLTESIAPRSDQMNAEDLLSGPRTFTIADVQRGASAEQPFDVHLAEFPQGRPFKPSKTVRRILVAAWGADANQYVGKRLTLYCDREVTFGREKVGGIRVSHMSDLPDGKPLTRALTVTRGKRAMHTVQPLKDEPKPTPKEAPEPTEADVNACADKEQLTAMWRISGPERRAHIEQRVADLQNEPATNGGDA